VAVGCFIIAKRRALPGELGRVFLFERECDLLKLLALLEFFVEF
jgi:hypothetical protein